MKGLGVSWLHYRLGSFFLPKHEFLDHSFSGIVAFSAKTTIKTRFLPKVTKLRPRLRFVLRAKRLQLLLLKFNLGAVKLEKIYFFRDPDRATRRKKRKLAFVARYSSRSSGLLQAENIWRLFIMQKSLNPYMKHHYTSVCVTKNVFVSGDSIICTLLGFPALANYFAGIFAAHESQYIGRLRFIIRPRDVAFRKTFLKNLNVIKNEEI